jgi:hypothetical protein
VFAAHSAIPVVPLDELPYPPVDLVGELARDDVGGRSAKPVWCRHHPDDDRPMKSSTRPAAASAPRSHRIKKRNGVKAVQLGDPSIRFATHRILDWCSAIAA